MALLWIAPAMLVVLYLGYAPVGDNLEARICLSSAAGALYSSACLRHCLRAQRDEFLGMRVAAMVSFI